MGSDNDNMQSGDESTGGSGGDDLTSALSGGGEMEFVTTDEKKPAANPILYMILVAALAGGGMYFMYKKQGPATAVAASTPEAAKAEQTINTFLTSGPEGIKAMQEMLKDTEKLVQQFLEYPSVTQVPLSDLHTNPFLFFRGETDVAPDADAEKRAKEKEKLAAIKASQELQLQSIVVSGSRKACMINNTLYEEGQQIEQFTVEKIEPKRVVVKTGTYRFELKISR